MKKITACLLTMLGINTACSHQNFDSADVQGFDSIINHSDVVLLDVRTPDEFAQGHIEGAVNINIKDDNFMSQANELISTDKTVAVYCRSGKRSAKAAGMLAEAGFKVVNLKGGIMAWQQAGMPITTVNYEVDTFTTTEGKTLKFHALVHASIWLEYDGLNILIDPVTKLGDRTIDYSAMPKADYIFVTHEHGDHLDKEAIKRLSDEKTRLITNRRSADILGYGEVMANGDNVKIVEGFTVDAVPAYNITEGHLQFHPKGRDNGFVFTLDGTRIYIAGDTEDIPEMALLKDIDIAFLPCNQPYTMTPKQLLNAARTIKPKVLFPYHYGKTDVSGIPAALQADGINVLIRHYE